MFSDDSDDCYLIEPKEMEKKLYEQILEVGINEHLENKESGIKFLCKMSVISLGNTPQEIRKKIAEIIEGADGYYYM